MRGDDVRAMQGRLLLISPVAGLTDSGYFGNATEAAVRAFQEREHIVSVGGPGYGTVGPRTLAALNKSAKSASETDSSPVASAAGTTTAKEEAVAAPQQAASTTSATTTPVVNLPVPDTTPPVRASGSPVGTIAATSSVVFSLTTNELARCYWSNTPGTTFSQMATSFQKTGGTLHSSKVDVGETGGDYAFYVRCRDRSLNANVSDYPILFSVERGLTLETDRDPPRVRMTFPIDNNKITEGPVNLLAAAADNVAIESVNFLLNGEDLNAADSKPPFGVTLILTPGPYTAYAVARDKSGRDATSPSVAFTVIAKSAPQGTTTALARPPLRSDISGVLWHFGVQVASASNVFWSALERLAALLSGGR